LFPILVASIILQKFIVNSITIVKGVDTNENQSLLQIFTFCYENKGKTTRLTQNQHEKTS